MVGRGRNGKTTLMEIIAFVLGPYAVAIENHMLLKQQYTRSSGGARSDLMALRSKRLAYASETSDGQSFNSGEVKWLTGGGTITAREPYGKRPVSFPPTHTLFLDTNVLPHVNNYDFAFAQRVHVIDFTESFVNEPSNVHEHQADPYLLETLKKEASGILAWLVRGCWAWQAEGLNPSDSVKANNVDYQKSEDSLSHFISECCILGPDKIVKAGLLFEAYTEWCRRTGHEPMNQTNFGKKIKDSFDFKSKDTGIHYVGIGLPVPDKENPEDNE